LEVNSASHSPWVVRQVVSHFNYEICELRRRPGNSVNAYLWVGVQGVVALSLLFAPIFLRRTHVKINKTASIDRFYKTKRWKFIFQQFYYTNFSPN
ncbi:hypothetical protein, partial [Leptospira noguchii]